LLQHNLHQQQSTGDTIRQQPIHLQDTINNKQATNTSTHLKDTHHSLLKANMQHKGNFHHNMLLANIHHKGKFHLNMLLANMERHNMLLHHSIHLNMLQHLKVIIPNNPMFNLYK
jgi:hypothetical protein